MPFAANLCELMKKKSITNYRLAKEIGVHQTTIKNWKEGTQPLIEHIKKVADYFDVTFDDLIS